MVCRQQPYTERKGVIYMNKKITAGILCAAGMAAAVLTPVTALADRVEEKPYLSLGADLNDQEKATVLELLEIEEGSLDNYDVYEVTNQQEYDYLGSYMDASLIGDRALSSVKVTGKESGYGIQVETHNITYCTEGMYQNALATAGMKDAEVIVAGPYGITGTAALVGAMEAYGRMTGNVIEPELADGATNELIVTSGLAESIGDPEKAEELIAAVKEIIVANEYTDPEEIENVINDVANKLEISLSEEDRQLIRQLMEKLSSLDLNLESIKEQASALYDRISGLDLSEYGITEEAVQGFFAKIGQFFSDLIEQIKSLF